MTDYLELLQRALAPDATPELRAAGAEAAGAIATALRAQPGQPLGPSTPAPSTHTSMVLEALIAKLRATLPPDAPADDERIRLNIPFVRMP